MPILYFVLFFNFFNLYFKFEFCNLKYHKLIIKFINFYNIINAKIP